MSCHTNFLQNKSAVCKIRAFYVPHIFYGDVSNMSRNDDDDDDVINLLYQILYYAQTHKISSVHDDVFFKYSNVTHLMREGCVKARR